MGIKEHTCESWLHLLELLYADTWNPALRRHRSPYVFRGVSSAAHGLRTSLQGLAGGGDAHALELHLLRNFRKYARRTVNEDDSSWHWLAVGQHYGLPTRLLDFSYSPLVALHFMTRDPSTFDRDGAVWMVNLARTNASLPEPLRDALEQEGSSVFTTDLLGSVTRQAPAPTARALNSDARTLDVLGRLSADPYLLFLEPPSIDERIAQQFALFSLPSDPALDMEALLAQQPDAAVKVIVPARLKWQVRDHLDQANVNERTLFPGLGGLAQWLRVYYTTPPEEAGPG
ncbi:FRG domain-containing protein [Deinococcus maricopensis]|uniref:FRG domain protein n=1 Tax=Deinococcus maricopensis (strain DSM 21211 / LMG 22137 / NRRL B-23946 / LB-34) TaxID=709986 RepID=E8U6I2_DEIML|nr:FRG domain-containing protein [Deinococcus maricopensis]ADV66671.1 FRG domain protein [Deinococcus maricopensis DSM 21211]